MDDEIIGDVDMSDFIFLLLLVSIISVITSILVTLLIERSML